MGNPLSPFFTNLSMSKFELKLFSAFSNVGIDDVVDDVISLVKKHIQDVLNINLKGKPGKVK